MNSSAAADAIVMSRSGTVSRTWRTPSASPRPAVRDRSRIARPHQPISRRRQHERRDIEQGDAAPPAAAKSRRRQRRDHPQTFAHGLQDALASASSSAGRSVASSAEPPGRAR